jgi:hypothetical protein
MSEMMDAPRRRGRPKGTGLDDTATLVAIAQLRSVDPDLKPTTAIRKLGITDPSVVRRLRDKLKSDDFGTTPHGVANAGSLTSRSAPPSGPRKSTLTPQRAVGPLQTKVTSKLPLRKQSSSKTVQAPAITPAAQSKHDVKQPDSNVPPLKAHEQPRRHTIDQSATGTIDPPKTNQHAEQPQYNVPQPWFTLHTTGPAEDPQVEAMRLASEAATAVSRLYLHCLVHAASISPMAMALRAQTMSGQWLTAFFAQYAPAGERPRKT